MKDPSDSKKQNQKNLNRKCDFCDNPSDLFAFQVERGTFREFYFCSECASSLSPMQNENKDKPKSIEDAFKRLKDQAISKKAGEMVESDIKDNKPFNIDKNNLKNKKLRSDCLCCGTKRKEIIESGIFHCSYCFDSFPDLESKFPEQFKKNLEELEKIINISEMEEKIKEAKDLIKNIPEEDKKSYLYKKTLNNIKNIEKKLKEYKENEE